MSDAVARCCLFAWIDFQHKIWIFLKFQRPGSILLELFFPLQLRPWISDVFFTPFLIKLSWRDSGVPNCAYPPIFRDFNSTHKRGRRKPPTVNRCQQKDTFASFGFVPTKPKSRRVTKLSIWYIIGKTRESCRFVTVTQQALYWILPSRQLRYLLAITKSWCLQMQVWH